MNSRKKFLVSSILFLCTITITFAQTNEDFVWKADNGDGTYKNPIIFADYSDPDVINVSDDFFMVSSSFSNFPGLPVLHSKDLVNWRIINHAAKDYPFKEFSLPQHGNGIWAPAIRFHDNEFYIYFGDPDHGILMTKTKDPYNDWEPLQIVHEAKGWIDPCPIWDDDGNAYLVHAWANSRSGIKSILTINKMSPDGKKILDEGQMIFDGRASHPTIEGPKMYKRNGYYYIFTPAGGVKPGWQTVLRSKNIYGPYEDKIVLEQGSTNINGPHQGGWVELSLGESWFVHFQDRYAYGRVVCLNSVKWINDWPEMGIDFDGNGIGEPLQVFNKPAVLINSEILIPQTSDEFDDKSLGLQWQWEALPDAKYYSLDESAGNLRLFSKNYLLDFNNLRDLPNILAQKFPAEEFSVTTKIKFYPESDKERAGLVILGMDYATIELKYEKGLFILGQVICKDADIGKPEKEVFDQTILSNEIYLKIFIRSGGVCTFAYSINGKIFSVIGKEFTAREGRWVGAKIGLFSTSEPDSEKHGFCDFEWFRINSL